MAQVKSLWPRKESNAQFDRPFLYWLSYEAGQEQVMSNNGALSYSQLLLLPPLPPTTGLETLEQTQLDTDW